MCDCPAHRQLVACTCSCDHTDDRTTQWRDRAEKAAAESDRLRERAEVAEADRVYGWLKSARENLCRAQTQLPAGDRDLVQGALDRIALIERDLDSGGWHRDRLRDVTDGDERA